MVSVDVRLTYLEPEGSVQAICSLSGWTGGQLNEVEPKQMGVLEKSDHQVEAYVVSSGHVVDRDLLNKSELTLQGCANAQKSHAHDRFVEGRNNDVR